VVRLAEAGGGLVIEVADRGPGMSPQDAAQAFDRFHRAASNSTDTGDPASTRDDMEGTTSRSAGSGLGLSIVQAIAHAHGGQVTLDSRLGHGTLVRIWLPTPPISPPGLAAADDPE
jgi:two-component system OmpR family sensor kinase